MSKNEILFGTVLLWNFGALTMLVKQGFFHEHSDRHTQIPIALFILATAILTCGYFYYLSKNKE